jgi:hypothetical protein
VTPNSPTWADIKEFLAADGWRELPSAERGGRDHIFYEKVLPDGRVLQTHVSHAAKKSLSAGRFRDILRYQLEVSKDAFWETVRTGEPVDRPAPVEEPEPFQHPAWVVAVLAGKLHMSGEDIAKLTPEEAQARVQQLWTTGS